LLLGRGAGDALAPPARRGREEQRQDDARRHERERGERQLRALEEHDARGERDEPEVEPGEDELARETRARLDVLGEPAEDLAGAAQTEEAQRKREDVEEELDQEPEVELLRQVGEEVGADRPRRDPERRERREPAGEEPDEPELARRDRSI